MIKTAAYYRTPRPGRAKLAGAPSLQGFYWNQRTKSWWEEISNKAPTIGKAGFKSIWLPPASKSADPNGYMPTEWYNFDSNYGTESELRRALTSLQAADVIALGDVVGNHRVGNENWGDFKNPAFPPEAVVHGDEWSEARGAHDTGAGVPYARDLDHQNPLVQEAMRDRIERTLALGVKGIRWDFAIGFAAELVGKYLRDAGIPPELSVGEVWTNLDVDQPDPHRQRIIDWIDGTGGASGAFDFTSKGLLQLAVAKEEYWRLCDGHGKASGVIGWYPERAWTFLDNHDTGYLPAGQGHWPFPGEKVAQGYAYLMTHPGTPMVFWPHFFDWGAELQHTIRSLMAVRSEMGIHANSKLDIRAAKHGLYAAVIDGLHGQVAVKLGTRDWNPGPGWSFAATSSDFVVWKKPSGS